MTSHKNHAKCPICGKEFKKKQKTQILCSRKCADVWKTRKRREYVLKYAIKYQDRKCKFCGNIFRSGDKKKKYCSRQCGYDFIKYMTKLRKRKQPNKSEKKLIRLIKENKLPFKFVGNKTFYIGKKNPDFIGTDEYRNKIIEFFGDYWHRRNEMKFHRTEEGRKWFYWENGYDCLIIWESELKEEEIVVKKIKNFLKRGDNVQIKTWIINKIDYNEFSWDEFMEILIPGKRVKTREAANKILKYLKNKPATLNEIIKNENLVRGTTYDAFDFLRKSGLVYRKDKYSKLIISEQFGIALKKLSKYWYLWCRGVKEKQTA